MAKLTGKAKAHFLKRMEKGRKAARKTRHAKYKTAKGKNKKRARDVQAAELIYGNDLKL